LRRQELDAIGVAIIGERLVRGDDPPPRFRNVRERSLDFGLKRVELLEISGAAAS
jgi:hypothetical protein